MISLSKLSPCAQEAIDRRMHMNMQKFSSAGVDSHLDVISLENCEYVAQLHAVEKTFPYYQRSVHDRQIVLRLSDQFLKSGVPALKEWAIAELSQDKKRLEQQIKSYQSTISVMLERLEQLEMSRSGN